MTQILVLVSLLAIGAALGWYFARRPSRAPQFVLSVAAAILLGAPVVLFVFANVLNSDTLGWIAGLSLLVILSSAPPVGAGVALGWRLARRRANSSSSVGESPLPNRTPSNATHTSRVASPPSSTSSLEKSAWIGQRGLLLAMAGVAAGFWVALALGFRLHHQQAPGVLDAGLFPAVLVLIGTLAIGVRHLWRNRGTAIRTFSTARVSRSRSTSAAQYRAWLDALSVDPRRRQYVTMIEAGDVFWTPERIEYDLDTQATTCCQHLAPIESAMRAARVQVRLDATGSVSAECRIDTDALARRFELPDCVKYEEPHAYDRSVEDPPQALVGCAACGSRVWVQHPCVASPSTPIFPAASN